MKQVYVNLHPVAITVPGNIENVDKKVALDFLIATLKLQLIAGDFSSIDTILDA